MREEPSSLRKRAFWKRPCSDRPTHMKPGVSQLLIASAMDANLRRRLLESPDETFEEFDLTGEEKDLLRHPDQRLLRLFGTALAEQRESSEPSPSHAPDAPHIIIQARTLPGITLALTLVPCAQYEH